MPIKKRAGKAKLGYPPLIQALLDGDTIAYSDVIHREVLDVFYFAWAEGVPDAAIRRAGEVLEEWRRAERNAD